MTDNKRKKPLSSTSNPLPTSPAAPAPPTGGELAAASPATSQTTTPDPKRSARGLPCLNSNNCTEGVGSEGQNPRHILRGYDLKKTYAVKCNAEKFIAETGLHRVGFLTLTFPDRLTDHKQASRRWHSLRTHFFPIFGHWQLVKERMVKGYLHFHILLDVKEDIRTGFDFELYQRSVDLRKQRQPYRHLERQAFRTANVQLRNLWATFRQVLPLYGFGRHELLPIRTTAEAAAKYVGKYVSKHLDARLEEDKGVRTYSRSQGQTGVSCRFAWHSPGGMEWRRKLGTFADRHGCLDLDDMKEKFGSRWAYHLCDIIMEEPTIGGSTA